MYLTSKERFNQFKKKIENVEKIFEKQNFIWSSISISTIFYLKRFNKYTRPKDER